MSKSLFLTAVVAGLLGYLAGHLPLADSTAAGSGENATALEPVAAGSAVSHYVCPMHAEIVREAPGSCPICGMDLVKQTPVDSTHKQDGMPAVTIAPSVEHNLAVRTAKASYGDLQRSIETIGKITRVDPMARRTLTPPIGGELVEIADKHDGDFVTTGELLFSVKSDELFANEKTFQDTYLSGDRATANAMIPALSKMGLSPEQISRLQAGETPQMPVEVHAFEDGFIYTRRGRVGDKVHTGFTVFNVGGNYRVIEVTAEIFERQWGWVEEGQKARMTVRGLPGSVFDGEVVRVEPPVGYTTRSLEVALKFRTDNPELSQSMFAHVSISGQARRNVLLVPTDTVIRTGEGDRVVLARGDNRFQPVEVVAGEEAGGMIEIRSGLQAGDLVVASGQFLIDSESNLLAGFRRLGTPGAARPDGGHTHQRAEDPDSHREPAAGDDKVHVKDDGAAVTQPHAADGYHPVTYTSESRF
jgi:membrane fusion protein, copper/silver efflux system